jgi:hypothetical protein
MSNGIARTRIVNVQPKAGNVVLLENLRQQDSRYIQDKLLEEARRLSDQWGDNLAGFVVFTWDFQGAWDKAEALSNDGPFVGMAALQFMHNALMAQIIAEGTAKRLGYDPEAV